MKEAFYILEKAQQSFLKVHEDLSIEQLNKIPEGFNNNLIWNYAHIIASLQMLCYVRPGLSPRLDDGFIHAKKIGTKPEGFINTDDYKLYQEYAIIGLNKLKEDYINNAFVDFKPFTTITGLEISSVEIAITYVIQHHGLHLGYSMAIKKLVL